MYAAVNQVSVVALLAGVAALSYGLMNNDKLTVRVLYSQQPATQ